MNTTVSLSLVNVCSFAFLSVLCATVYGGMRRHSSPASQGALGSLAWLAAALLIGSIEITILGVNGGTTAELAAITLMAPVAYLCVAQAARLIVGHCHQNWRVIAGVGTLQLASLLLLGLEVPFIYQTAPFQLACALAIVECKMRLGQAPHRGSLDALLALGFAALLSVFLIRIPLYFWLFDGTTTYAAVKASQVDKILLTTSGLLTPPIVCMLLAKIIGGVIETYRRRSERDGLTGLLNRQAFHDLADRRQSCGGAVVFCDIDHFKRVNDRYGHHVGDIVLRAFANLLDVTGFRAGRVGGEEFALLMPGASAIEAARIANAIRASFRPCVDPTIAPDLHLSASFGISAYAAGERAKSAFVRADRSLYRAKAEGRDRVKIELAADANGPGDFATTFGSSHLAFAAQNAV